MAEEDMPLGDNDDNGDIVNVGNNDDIEKMGLGLNPSYFLLDNKQNMS